MFRQVRCVLFDLDGTLIDSAADLGGAADDMRVARGLPPLPVERYRVSAGSGARGMLGVAFDITPEHAEFAADTRSSDNVYFFTDHRACWRDDFQMN